MTDLEIIMFVTVACNMFTFFLSAHVMFLLIRENVRAKKNLEKKKIMLFRYSYMFVSTIVV